MVKLTPREIQVINLISQGLSDKLIGDKLGITFRTAQMHVKNINKKYKGNRTKSAVQFFRRDAWSIGVDDAIKKVLDFKRRTKDEFVQSHNMTLNDVVSLLEGLKKQNRIIKPE